MDPGDGRSRKRNVDNGFCRDMFMCSLSCGVHG